MSYEYQNRHAVCMPGYTRFWGSSTDPRTGNCIWENDGRVETKDHFVWRTNYPVYPTQYVLYYALLLVILVVIIAINMRSYLILGGGLMITLLGAYYSYTNMSGDPAVAKQIEEYKKRELSWVDDEPKVIYES